jgi:archaeal flagellar protein FlaJ
MVEVYKRIAALLPQGIVKAFRKELEYLDIDISEKRFVGFLLLYGFFLSLGVAVNAFLFFKLDMIAMFVFSFGLFFGGVYLWLGLAAESKGKFVENILPDALQLIASNVKSGLTTERALLVSARPEFGPLEKELKRASKEVMAGEKLDKALLGISTRIKSRTLERTLWLISRGITSGGQIADLLIELSDDLREQFNVQQEINSNISMYVLLIFFTSAFGAPVLFGVSSFIVEVITAQMSGIPAISPELVSQAGGRAGIATSFVGMGGEAAIPAGFVIFFIMICLTITSLFASMTIGVINSGSEKGGAKIAPIILFISFSLFFAVRWVFDIFFGGLLA